MARGARRRLSTPSRCSPDVPSRQFPWPHRVQPHGGDLLLVYGGRRSPPPRLSHPPPAPPGPPPSLKKVVSPPNFAPPILGAPTPRITTPRGGGWGAGTDPC